MEDHDIIDLFWQRSESAIEAVGQKYSTYCRAIAGRFLASDMDVEECLNDTWLGAWNAMPDAWPDRLRVFLGRITRNLAMDKFDYLTAQKRNSEYDSILSELEECLAAPDNVQDQYEQGEVAREISGFLRELDETGRQLFLRRYWYADSIADLAARFHMSESKVKSMLFRTRKKLRIHLEKEGYSL